MIENDLVRDCKKRHFALCEVTGILSIIAYYCVLSIIVYLLHADDNRKFHKYLKEYKLVYASSKKFIKKWNLFFISLQGIKFAILPCHRSTVHSDVIGWLVGWQKPFVSN